MRKVLHNYGQKLHISQIIVDLADCANTGSAEPFHSDHEVYPRKYTISGIINVSSHEVCM